MTLPDLPPRFTWTLNLSLYESVYLGLKVPSNMLTYLFKYTV